MVIIVPRDPTALKRNFHPSLPQLHISKVRECRITAWFVSRDTKWTTSKSSKEMDVNQRAQRAKERRLCFRCLNSSKHRVRQCNEKGRCGVENCPKYHHPLIHGAAPFFCGSSRCRMWKFNSSVAGSPSGYTNATKEQCAYLCFVRLRQSNLAHN